MNTTPSFKTVFPANTLVQLSVSNKPFEDCYALDDAYEDFCQMGFNAMLLEGERLKDEEGRFLGQLGREDGEISPLCYVLLVADYAQQEDSSGDIITKMSKALNEKPLEIQSERIEECLKEVGVNPDTVKVVSINDVNNQPKLYEIIRQNRMNFITR